jgi:photosystem II stability/assembly factor-like uncharacterized protein
MKTPLFLLVAVAFGWQGCAPYLPVAVRWEHTGGPYAQNVSALMIDEHAPTHLLAGLTTGEVFTSSDEGRAWVRRSVIRPHTRINQLIQHPEAEGTVFAATDAGTFVSTDRGGTWAALPIAAGTDQQPACRVLVIDPWKTNVMYAGVRATGVCKSVDGGRTWKACSLPGDVNDLRIDVARPDNLLAAVAGSGILRSTDAGTTWSRITEEMPATGASATQVLLRRSKGEHVLYATSAGNIYRTTNGGALWSPSRFGQDAGTVRTLAADPADAATAFAGTGAGLLVSSDFGSTWGSLAHALPPLPLSVAVAPASNRVYVFGPGIGLQQSTDGGRNWIHADASLGGASITVLATDASGENLYAATDALVLQLQTATHRWTPAGSGIVGGPISALAVDPEQPSVLYVTTPGAAYRSTNNGATWQVLTSAAYIAPHIIDTHPWFRTRLLASGPQGIFVSTDKGMTWNQSLPPTSHYQVHSFTYMPTNAGTVRAATENSAVVTSTNGGLSWETTRYGLPTDSIVAVTLDDKEPQTLYAYTNRGEEYRSTNGGVEWNRYAPPWRSLDTVQVSFDRLQPSSVIALVNSRDVYYSPSGGGTWVLLTEAGLGADATAVCWSAATETLFASTDEKGVFSLSLARTLRERFSDRQEDDETVGGW